MKEIEEKLKEVMDDEYRGLKQTSNTNKSRMEILALFEEAYERGRREALSPEEDPEWTGPVEQRHDIDQT